MMLKLAGVAVLLSFNPGFSGSILQLAWFMVILFGLSMILIYEVIFIIDMRVDEYEEYYDHQLNEKA